MKILKILVAVLMFALFSTTAYSQNTAVPISAEILSALSITTAQNVVFGDVNNNLDAYVQANASDDADANAGTGTAGAVSISDAANNATLTIGWNTNVQLEETTDGNLINFTPTIYFGSTELLTSGGTDITLSGTTGTLDIGGALSSAGAPAGTYSSDLTYGTPLTISVDYSAN